MTLFRFCFIVEIIEETNQDMALDINNSVALALGSILRAVDGQMVEADAKCDKLMKTLHAQYFPDIDLKIDGSGYYVSDSIREIFYIVTLIEPNLAKSFLEKIDKILYDFRDSDKIQVDGNTAYINRKFFAKKATDFGHELVAYDLLKNLDL